MLGKLICWITKKHKRGKLLAPTDAPHVPGKQNVLRYACPRCGRVKVYKAKSVTVS